MKAPVLNVKELVTATRAGDLDAYTALYDTYHGFLFHFSLKFLKSRGLAEEVVHDVFLKIWEERNRLDPDRNIKAYLATICKNHILNLLKRANREAAVMDEIRQSLSHSCNDVEEAIFASELQETVNQVVGQLPTQRQKIFRMYRFQDMNLDEIAKQLHISKGTVKDHMAKANRFVRHSLQARTETFLEISLLVVLSLM